MSLILSGTDGLSDVDGTAATPAIRGTDANTGIFFPAADTIGFSEGGVEAMRITSAGNVNIGTGTAQGKLEIQQSTATAALWVQTGGTTSADVVADFRTGSNAPALQILGNATSLFWSTVGVGNATPSTSGAGITFPTAQSASSNANTLDDYEEGTWTPNSTGITVVGTFSSSGIYTKIGRQVTVIANFQATTSVAVSAGTAFSSNIPIAAGNLGIDNPGTFFRFGLSGGEIIVAQSDTRFYAGQAIGAVANFQISATYFV